MTDNPSEHTGHATKSFQSTPGGWFGTGCWAWSLVGWGEALLDQQGWPGPPKEMKGQQGQHRPHGHEGAQCPSAGTKTLSCFWKEPPPPPPTPSVLGIPAATSSACPPVTQQCPYQVLHPGNPAKKEEKGSVRTHQPRFSPPGMRKPLPKSLLLLKLGQF